MTPIKHYNGIPYYLVNSAYVEKLIINNTEYDVSNRVLLYSRNPANAGSLWGYDDILLVYNGVIKEFKKAYWIYGTRRLIEHVNIPFANKIKNPPDVISLIIVE